MDQNNKTLLIAVLVMLLALVALNFNNISGRASGGGDNSHPLSLTAGSTCSVGTRILGSISGNFGGETHDPKIIVRRDSLSGPVVGTDKSGQENVVRGYFSNDISWNCEEGTHRYYAIMSSRTGDHADYGMTLVTGR